MEINVVFQGDRKLEVLNEILYVETYRGLRVFFFIAKFNC